MLIKERKTTYMLSRHRNSKIIYNTPKLTEIHYSNTDFDIKCFKEGEKTAFSSLKFSSDKLYNAYAMFSICCAFVYKYIHFE